MRVGRPLLKEWHVWNIKTFSLWCLHGISTRSHWDSKMHGCFPITSKGITVTYKLHTSSYCEFQSLGNLQYPTQWTLIDVLHRCKQMSRCILWEIMARKRSVHLHLLHICASAKMNFFFWLFSIYGLLNSRISGNPWIQPKYIEGHHKHTHTYTNMYQLFMFCMVYLFMLWKKINLYTYLLPSLMINSWLASFIDSTSFFPPISLKPISDMLFHLASLSDSGILRTWPWVWAYRSIGRVLI